MKYLASLKKMNINAKDIIYSFLIIFQNQLNSNSFKIIFLWYLKKKIKIYETILYKACKDGNVELVKFLVSLDRINVNDRDTFKIRII